MNVMECIFTIIMVLENLIIEYPRAFTKSGPVNANADRIDLKILGKGSHAMSP
jgi:hypothetical protein